MKTTIAILSTVLVALHPCIAAESPPPKPVVDVVFVIDSTGFMGSQQERARLTKEGKGDAFDLKVEETIKEQIKRTTAPKP